MQHKYYRPDVTCIGGKLRLFPNTNLFNETNNGAETSLTEACL